MNRVPHPTIDERPAPHGRSARRSATLAVSLAVSACAGAAAPSSTPPAATEAEWRQLASPRPAPVAGAARVSLTGVEIVGRPSWPTGSVDAGLAASELVVAGLLRRSDVRFVERRRFAEAVASERSGGARPAAAPPAGTSEGAEILAAAVWVQLPAGSSIEVRLTDAARGSVLGTRRTTIPADADLVSTARVTVGAILDVLGELGRRPPWRDPVERAAPAEYVAADVPARAVSSFLAGLAAEESWRWESARVSYQAAAARVGFFEAETALARAARLRLGGTLGES